MMGSFSDSSVEELRGVHFYNKNKVIRITIPTAPGEPPSPEPPKSVMRDTCVTNIRDAT